MVQLLRLRRAIRAIPPMMNLLRLLQTLREAIHLLQVLGEDVAHWKHVGASSGCWTISLEPIALAASRMRAFLGLCSATPTPEMLVRDGRIAHATT